MSQEYFEERRELEKVQPTQEFFCSTCRTAVVVKEADSEGFHKDISEFEKTKPLNGKPMFIPPSFRQMDKKLKEVGVIFTKDSIMYNCHLKYMNKEFEEGDHIVGKYNA